MTPRLDLKELVDVLGPRFAEGAAERDARDVFVAEHYDILREQRVFSALVPGGARWRRRPPQRNVHFPASARPLLSGDGAGPGDAPASRRGSRAQLCPTAGRGESYWSR